MTRQPESADSNNPGFTQKQVWARRRNNAQKKKEEEPISIFQRQ